MVSFEFTVLDGLPTGTVDAQAFTCTPAEARQLGKTDHERMYRLYTEDFANSGFSISIRNAYFSVSVNLQNSQFLRFSHVHCSS